MRSYLGATCVALLLGGSSASSMSCSPCRVGGQEAVDYTDGNTNSSRTLYETARPDEEMLHFPQGRIYRLYHGFGYRPADLTVFLSFRPRLTSSGDKEDKTNPNNVSESAGNQAVIEAWTENYIQVRNDTCAEFYMRAVIVGDPELAEATTGIGGAAGSQGL